MSAATSPSVGSPVEDAFGHRRRMIGQWKLGRTIGKGSSGRVKIARHSVTRKLAAVKIIPKRNATLSAPQKTHEIGDEDRIARSTEREIVIMKLIDHPHVLKLYDVWETSNQLYLILEYIEGGELFEYIVQKGRLDLNEALRYFQQIIHAVHYCHCFNIAHRDLKPENILLDKNKNVKVADFGMAIWESAAGMLETSCGSPHYASPEILNGKRYSGASADVWSCGVILYALMTGTLPFHDEAIEVLLRKVRAGQFDMPQDIPKEAQDLISRMLQKDVSKRITIPAILRHPFFCMLPTSEPSERRNAVLLMENLIEPVPQVEQVDAEVFANLRTLWPTLSDKVLLDRLQSEKKTWQKAVYHLLCRYRTRELNGIRTRELSRKDSEITKPVAPTPKHTVQALTAEPPSLRSEWFHVANECTDKPHSSQEQQVLQISSDLPLEPRDHANEDQLLGLITNFPPLAVPNFSDEGVQKFFHQVVERLDYLQSNSPVLTFSDAARFDYPTHDSGSAPGTLTSSSKENKKYAAQAKAQPRRHRQVLQDETNKRRNQDVQLGGSEPVAATVGRWFINAMKFKKAVFVLLSTKDVEATRDECARLLRNLEVSVRVVRGELKCIFPKQGPTISQFLVRITPSTKTDAVAGHPTSINLTLVKGEVNSFQIICNGLRENWYYDVLPAPLNSSR